MAATGADAVLHHLPDVEQTAAGLGFRAPCTFVGHHHLADRQVMGDAMAQQVLGGLERVLQLSAVLHDAVSASGAFIHHKPPSDRVILAAADLYASGIERTKNHAVRVVGQGFADHCQVQLFIERDGVLAQQIQLPAATDRGQTLIHGVGVDGVRVLAFQAQEHGFVAAVAFAGGAERAIQFHFDAGGCVQ